MECAYCGKEFTGRRRKYCSKECNDEAYKARMRANYKWISVRHTHCDMCGKELPPRRIRFCSVECGHRWHNIKNGWVLDHGELTKTCCVCGKEFKTWKTRKDTCSEKCSRIMKNQKHDFRRDAKSGIELRKLAERDGQICHLCGEPVQWDDFEQKGDYKVFGNKYPSIDHVLPISLGGQHSWDNVRLAHRQCNSMKGNRFIG